MTETKSKTGSYMLPSSLPSATNISFPETTFFKSGNKHLPSPADVRLAAAAYQTKPLNRPTPVAFPALNLIVKYGPTITISEGQCLWAITRFCPNVPVPEVFGWCQDDGETFIYMQRIAGATLQQEWPGLDFEEKYGVCVQLYHIINELRQLQQDPATQFIGTINQGPLQDIIFAGQQPTGVFPNVSSFHTWFSTPKRQKTQNADLSPDPTWRSGLLDDVPIVFTHGDLHRSNILISRDEHEGTVKIAGIVDWHQSGWYPAPWEFYKTRFTCRDGDQWELDFILEFLQAYRGYISWDYFVLAMGV
ncbi:Uncharacterized protein BP5553_03622 [Venustampulla echinocandica]|uniref:Aminoglycoside phosphotransferase domain-containing protein n=1 Tax=Venustampulla echinocandica TaxID=2656787 RepID=A0A370TUR4_9HELO|nr:Uncharacterized protein BP5553_03622 [Venustampulla echinocandica]RDL39282.1 Uncharacterized protein BP5553_03622 [Venustampulla echinocandica]